MYFLEILGFLLFILEIIIEVGDDELVGFGDWDGDFRWVVVF